VHVHAGDPTSAEPQYTLRVRKKRHHFVWMHYLNAWSVGGQLWCRQADGRSMCSNPVNLGVGKHFYRLHDITEADADFLAKMVNSFKSPMLVELGTVWVNAFRAVPALRRQYLESENRTTEGEAAFDDVIHNMEEELHTGIEHTGLPLLAKAAVLDASFVEDDQGYVDWTLFVAMQYMRTPKQKARGTAALDGLAGVNAEACWGALRTVLAT
jgi:hypothetical protein